MEQEPAQQKDLGQEARVTLPKPRGFVLSLGGQLDYDVEAQALVALKFPRGRIFLFVMGLSLALDWNTKYSEDTYPPPPRAPRTS